MSNRQHSGAAAGHGRDLGMSVVAGGIETQNDRDVIRPAGVEISQRHFVAKPMPADKIPSWLTRPARPHDASGYLT